MTEDTKFPKKIDITTPTTGRIVYSYFYSKNTEDWFKQCMEDSPIHETKYGLWEDWYSKWFSQFKETEE